MDTYELLLTLHVLSVIVWLGAALAVSLLILRFELAGDAAGKAEVNAGMDWMAPRVFIPASLATLVFGVLTVIEGPWDFDQLWVVLGLAGWLASFGVGIGYFKAEGERLVELVAERGSEDPEVQRRIDTMEMVGRIELAVLFLVVVVMVTKPTGDDTGVLIALAAILAGVTALLLARARA